MKTIKLTVHHGQTLESITGTGPTIDAAITDLGTKKRLAGYAIETDSRYYPDFCATLESTGKAQFGWGDYEMIQTEPKPAAHTPGPWLTHGELDNLAVCAESEDARACDGVRQICRVICGDYEVPNYREHEANAARIVACVNACAGMTDPAAEIAALREALANMLACADARDMDSMANASEAARAALAK